VLSAVGSRSNFILASVYAEFPELEHILPAAYPVTAGICNEGGAQDKVLIGLGVQHPSVHVVTPTIGSRVRQQLLHHYRDVLPLLPWYRAIPKNDPAETTYDANWPLPVNEQWTLFYRVSSRGKEDDTVCFSNKIATVCLLTPARKLNW
jgi:hypothetical protein